MMDALQFALSRVGEPHKHHRHCVHNVSADDQIAMRRRRIAERFPNWPVDEVYKLIYGDSEPVVITPDQWEIEVPDLDFSAYTTHEIRQSPGWWPQFVECVVCGLKFDLNSSSDRHRARYGRCGEEE